jgi:hypothetical protein
MRIEPELDIYKKIPADKNGQKLIDSISDHLIKEISDSCYLTECGIARYFLGRDELFVNRYPKVYGTKRKNYTNLDSDTKDKLRFLMNLAMQKKILNNQNKLINLKDQMDVHGERGIKIKKKFFVNFLCSFIPFKTYRNNIRKYLLQKLSLQKNQA